jgi:hypothetical protein
MVGKVSLGEAHKTNPRREYWSPNVVAVDGIHPLEKEIANHCTRQGEMSKDSALISVVVCAYTHERWSDLVKAISSIQRQSRPVDEVVLVIDHNPSLYKMAQGAFVGVRVIENQEMRGLSGARNSGIAHTRGQIIAFMDEDAVASSKWIENLLGGYTSENVLGVGGDVRPLWTGNAPGWLPEEFNWVVGCSYKGLPERMAVVRNPIGCNMSFRRQALVTAGGFRNDMGRIGIIPVGCEETELSIRLRKQHPEGNIIYQPEAVVYHRVPEWRVKWGYFTRRCFAEGLSKAQVSQIGGANDGLSSERSYTAVTLPRGMLRGIKEAALNRDLDGLRRCGSIAIGLIITTIGYLFGLSRHVDIRALQIRSERPLVINATEGEPVVDTSMGQTKTMDL